MKKYYAKIAKNLLEFGYSDITPKMIEEIHLAMKAKESLPHGIIGMFAKDQLEEVEKLVINK